MEAIMHKLLLATAFAAAFSAPAMAAYTKAESEQTAQHLGVMREHRAASEVLPPRTERGEINDPYWSPCDYSIDWGPNSCD
jgi:hypothetical protein